MSLNFKHYIDFEDLRLHGGKLVHHGTANSHVVGISRATDPLHLKILGGFDETLMKRSLEADEEIDRLRNNPECQFEVLDLKKMSGFKIVFYNLQGLQSGEKVMHLRKDGTLLEADLLLGCETNLKQHCEVEKFDIPGFYNIQFNGKLSQIGRGLIIYSKEKKHLDNTQSIMKDHVEYGKISLMIENVKVVIIFMYRSEKYPMHQFRSDLAMLIDKNEGEKNVVILGDMNCESNLIFSEDYDQIIDEPTTCELTRIDHAYVKLEDFDANGLVLYKSFVESYHHPICVHLWRKQNPGD